MTLESLKDQWKNEHSREAFESIDAKLAQGDRSLKGVRRRLVIESILFFIVSLVFWDGFDGDQRPLVMSFLLVAAFSCLIMNDVMLLLSLHSVNDGLQIRAYLEQVARQLRLQSWISPALIMITNCCWIGFFLSGNPWRQEKLIPVFIMLMTILGVGIVTHCWWTQRLKPILAVLDELSALTENPKPQTGQDDSLT